MLARPSDVDYEAFATYARSLHEYTLGLWAESIRAAEENNRLRIAVKGARMTKEEGRTHKEAARVAEPAEQRGSACAWKLRRGKPLPAT